jgi:hypothetical protein
LTKAKYMAVISVSNGYESSLIGLGTARRLLQLSENRITTVARKTLGKHYGPENVEVSSGAEWVKNRWRGQCTVHGESLVYEIYEVRRPTRG